MASDELARLVEIFYMRQGFFAKSWVNHHTIIVSSIVVAILACYNPLFLIKLALQIGPLSPYLVAVIIPMSYVVHLLWKERTHAKIESILVELDEAMQNNTDIQSILHRFGHALPYFNGLYQDRVRLVEFLDYIESEFKTKANLRSLKFFNDLIIYIQTSSHVRWYRKNFSIIS